MYYFQPSIDLLLPEYTSVSGTDIKFVYNAAVGAANVPRQHPAAANVVFYNQQPTDNQRGDFEDASKVQVIQMRNLQLMQMIH